MALQRAQNGFGRPAEHAGPAPAQVCLASPCHDLLCHTHSWLELICRRSSSAGSCLNANFQMLLARWLRAAHSARGLIGVVLTPDCFRCRLAGERGQRCRAAAAASREQQDGRAAHDGGKTAGREPARVLGRSPRAVLAFCSPIHSYRSSKQTVERIPSKLKRARRRCGEHRRRRRCSRPASRQTRPRLSKLRNVVHRVPQLRHRTRTVFGY